jgi:mRNA-degrading endonuclease RelE of RelBE toxin-antitoxin system
MKVIISPKFERIIKKLHDNQKKELDKAVLLIKNNPTIGESKIGDLNGIRVYKFKMNNCLTLIAYEIDNEDIILIHIGSHQNFYETLKRK